MSSERSGGFCGCWSHKQLGTSALSISKWLAVAIFFLFNHQQPFLSSLLFIDPLSITHSFTNESFWNAFAPTWSRGWLSGIMCAWDSPTALMQDHFSFTHSFKLLTHIESQTNASMSWWMLLRLCIIAGFKLRNERHNAGYGSTDSGVTVTTVDYIPVTTYPDMS